MALTQMGTDTAATYLLDYNRSQLKKPEGAFHTVHLTSNRKGVRLVSQQVYLAAAIHAPAKGALPPEPAFTFVGSVQSITGQSMVLKLDDARFVVIDFGRNAKVNLSMGDRASV